MADIVELDKYRERQRSPTREGRKIEYDQLSKREKRIYRVAWWAGVQSEWTWIQDRLSWLLSLEPTETEEYLHLVSIIGDGLPPAVKELLRELISHGPKSAVLARRIRRGRRRR